MSTRLSPMPFQTQRGSQSTPEPIRETGDLAADGVDLEAASGGAGSGAVLCVDDSAVHRSGRPGRRRSGHVHDAAAPPRSAASYANCWRWCTAAASSARSGARPRAARPSARSGTAAPPAPAPRAAPWTAASRWRRSAGRRSGSAGPAPVDVARHPRQPHERLDDRRDVVDPPGPEHQRHRHEPDRVEREQGAADQQQVAADLQRARASARAGRSR